MAITYESMYGTDGSFYTQSGVEWTKDELAASQASGQSEATCPSCGYWTPVSNATSMSCPTCDLSKGIVSPIAQMKSL